MECHGKDLRQTLFQALQPELDRRQIRLERHLAQRMQNILQSGSGQKSWILDKVVDQVLARYPWPSAKDKQLAEHYLRRRGWQLTLSSLGLLGRVQIVANGRALTRFRSQILQKGKKIMQGRFEDRFDNSYDFTRALFSLGNATLNGHFTGNAQPLANGKVRVIGTTWIHFHDIYEDPLGIQDWVREEIRGLENVTLPDVTGRKFVILDSWQLKIDEIG